MYKDDYKTEIYPNKQILRFQCCDCGLVHDISLKAERDNPIIVRMVVNNRATGQIRRHRQIKIIKGG